MYPKQETLKQVGKTLCLSANWFSDNAVKSLNFFSITLEPGDE